jgi:hypothetical protein
MIVRHSCDHPGGSYCCMIVRHSCDNPGGSY